MRTGLLDGTGYRFISPTSAERRAAIIVLSPADPAGNQALHQRLTDAALRAGNIRLSPASA